MVNYLFIADPDNYHYYPYVHRSKFSLPDN